MDIDITWKEPTEAQAAALDYAMRFGDPLIKASMHKGEGEWYPPITEFHIAEMMCMESLSYHEATAWAEGKVPRWSGVDMKDLEGIFTMAGKALVALMDHGYNPETKQWYDPIEVWEDATIASLGLAAISDVCRIIYRVEHRGLSVWDILSYEEGTTPLISAWLKQADLLFVSRYVPRSKAWKWLETKHGAAMLIATIRAHLDPDYREEYNAAIRDARVAVSEEYKPTICIHPECDHLVAPKGIKPREGHFKNYRGTGACQEGHNSYLCTKCDAPHSFASKIGQEHYPEYNGGDWTKERRQARR